MGIGFKRLAQHINQSFPFCYHDELVFYKPDSFDNTLFMKQLGTKYEGTISNECLVASVPNPVSKIPIKVSFRFQPDPITGKVSFTLSLFELNLSLIFFVALGLFFRFYQNPLFSYLAIVSGILFYFISIHASVTGIKKSIIQISGTTFDLGELELWKKQQGWMKNELLCPACGEPKNPYSYQCVSCGIYFAKALKDNERVQINTTGTENVHYHYSKKNEKNSR
ncbi:MAG: hypothetical protein WCX31_18215 [Salinivirgaceae bacterium]